MGEESSVVVQVDPFQRLPFDVAQGSLLRLVGHIRADLNLSTPTADCAYKRLEEDKLSWWTSMEDRLVAMLPHRNFFRKFRFKRALWG